MIKLGFMFSGQGSQYKGMGYLADRFKIAQCIFDQASDILGYDLLSVMNDSNPNVLQQTEYAQPAIFTYSYAWYQILKENYNIKPVCGAGHSLGEFTALTCSGVLSFDDALTLVNKRGQLMQQAAENSFGGMAAIKGLHRSIIEEVCSLLSKGDRLVQISNINTEDQIVISGENSKVRQASDKLAKLGGTVYPVHVSAPFHTPYMASANAQLLDILSQINFADGEWPVIGNVTAKPYVSLDDIRTGISHHMLHPVRWSDSMDWMLRQGVNTFIEIGPRSALRNMMKQTLPHIDAFSCEEHDNQIAELMSEYNQPKYVTLLSACLSTALLVPNRNNNREEYEYGALQPLKELSTLEAKSQEKKLKETDAEQREALRLFQRIITTKKVDEDEIFDYFFQVSIKSAIPIKKLMQLMGGERL
ncbi:ACP S-malonyltransferase [Paenibacillus sp. AN1007]|uniref:[acyl-carrier-protein] S-malonyltransferase n=1 Tax=Paenibacillus sp. AN1007 TaxID=3151385 RepID=A0AAU8NJA4_9BACL